MSNGSGNMASEATSLLDNILKKARSDELSKSIGTLIDIWTSDGLSKAEIEEKVKQFQDRENQRRKQLDDLDKKIGEREKDLEASDLQLKQLEEIRARIRLEMATLEGRIAQRERTLAELEVENSKKEKDLADLLKKLNI